MPHPGAQATLRHDPAPGTAQWRSSRHALSKATPSSVHVELQQEGRRAVRSLVAEALRKRGRETVMLGFDLEALEPRAINGLVVNGG